MWLDKNNAMSDFIICNQYYAGNRTKEDEWSEACSKHKS